MCPSLLQLLQHYTTLSFLTILGHFTAFLQDLLPLLFLSSILIEAPTPGHTFHFIFIATGEIFPEIPLQLYLILTVGILYPQARGFMVKGFKDKVFW